MQMNFSDNKQISGCLGKVGMRNMEEGIIKSHEETFEMMDNPLS